MRYEGKSPADPDGRKADVTRYDRKFLGSLLDSYEGSLLSRGENKVRINITFPFTKKTMPAYFDESSPEYEDIHSAAERLESMGFIRIIWKNGKTGHIISKLQLEEESAGAVYSYLGRVPRTARESRITDIMESACTHLGSPAVVGLAEYVKARLADNKSVKSFIDTADPDGARLLMRMVHAVETNVKECYIRELSGRRFADTKLLESHLGAVCRIIRRFGHVSDPEHLDCGTDMDDNELLASFNIYRTPNYIYMKGSGKVQLGDSFINLTALSQGIGISGEDIDNLKFIPDSADTGDAADSETTASETRDSAEFGTGRKIITVENLTTFFRWHEKNSLIIYLGGYPNAARIRLIKSIGESMPDAQLLHFGDIDVGGFEILESLRMKSGMDFRPYRMGVRELTDYRRFAKKLTANDRKRLDMLITSKKNDSACLYMNTLSCMAENGIKLEQECIENSWQEI